jgi:hypothetical protein
MVAAMVGHWVVQSVEKLAECLVAKWEHSMAETMAGHWAGTSAGHWAEKKAALTAVCSVEKRADAKAVASAD